MSTKISKKRFIELVRNLLQKEIEEASTTTSAGIDGTGTGHYDTPKAFSTGSGHPTDGEVGGYKKVNEGGPGSGKPKDGSSKEKSKTDDKEMERRAKDQAKKDMEDEFDFDFDESINENLMSFYKYMGDFYGKKGIYPDKKGRDLKVGDVNKALSVYLKKYAKDQFTGDSLDRERVRDILIKMRKLDPDYSKKESVNEDAKDVSKARKLSQKLQSVESRYRKVMYELSDRLQADPKNHKLQDELIKSYTKHVTTFMKDMIKITKRVK